MGGLLFVARIFSKYRNWLTSTLEYILHIPWFMPAAMIANPNDLVQGQDGSTTGAATATRAIRSYRQATPTGQVKDHRPCTARGA